MSSSPSTSVPSLQSPQTIGVLPPPVYSHNPQLLSNILVRLSSCCGLEHGEFLVLSAVLQHMPIPSAVVPLESGPTTTQLSPTVSSPAPVIDRILSLPIDQLKLLASLFTSALLDARSWGGRRRRDATSTDTYNLSTLYSAGSPTAAGTGLEQEQEQPSLALYDKLFQSLGITPLPDLPSQHDASVPVPAHHNNRSSQAENCFERHLRRCPITFKQHSLEHAHIIPCSVAALRQKSSLPFWLVLAICLGPALRNQVFNIVGAANSSATTNSLALDSTIHKYFDHGLVHLVPMGIDPDSFDHTTCRQLDVSFRWWSTLDELGTCTTTVRLNAEDQVEVSSTDSAFSSSTPPAMVHVRGGPIRIISDGDVFRLFTCRPDAYPLPHPLLLDIHCMLWRMIRSAGLAESNGGKKRRYAEASIEDENGSDGSDDRRAPKKGRRRARRPGRRDRSTMGRNKKSAGKESGVDGGDKTAGPGYKQGSSGTSHQGTSRTNHQDTPGTNHQDDGLTECKPISSLADERSPPPSAGSAEEAPTEATAIEPVPISLEMAWLDFQLRQHVASNSGYSHTSESSWSALSSSEDEDDYNDDYNYSNDNDSANQGDNNGGAGKADYCPNVTPGSLEEQWQSFQRRQRCDSLQSL